MAICCLSLADFAIFFRIFAIDFSSKAIRLFSRWLQRKCRKVSIYISTRARKSIQLGLHMPSCLRHTKTSLV